MNSDDISPQHDTDEEISKSAIKREMQRWQDLGQQLSTLNPQQWQHLTISDNLHAALVESKRLKQHEAKRRHLQYIGKLMRDENIEAIQQELDLLNPSSEAYGRLNGQIEQWRTRLVQDTTALNAFIDEYPTVDRQHIRNLVRNARKEMQQTPPKPGSAYKKLFQLIKEHML